MQKLPFKQLKKSVLIIANKWATFKAWLKSQGKTFSGWVREKINQELL